MFQKGDLVAGVNNLGHLIGHIAAVSDEQYCFGRKKKLPTPVYLHMKGLACQQLQAVDKGFVSPVISWISSVLFEQKGEEREGNYY